MLRSCSLCNTTKHQDNFYKTYRKNRGWEYSYYCKKCQGIKAKEYSKNSLINKKRYRDKNKEELRRKRQDRVKNLDDTYVIECISTSLKIPYSLAKQNQSIIDFYRAKIKLKRLLKDKNNGIN